MAGRAKENLPGGSLKYLFVYVKIRIFKCNYRIIYIYIYPIGSMYAIYGNIYHQYTPFMLAYIPAPWILWVYLHKYNSISIPPRPRTRIPLAEQVATTIRAPHPSRTWQWRFWASVAVHPEISMPTWGECFFQVNVYYIPFGGITTMNQPGFINHVYYIPFG